MSIYSKYEKDSNVLLIRGNAEYELEQYSIAVETYKEAISLEPNNAILYNDLGLALIYLDKYDDAIVYCNKSIELDSNYATPYNTKGLAKSYTNIGLEESISDYLESARIEPKYTVAVNNVLQAYIDTNNIHKAFDYITNIHDSFVLNDPIFQINKGIILYLSDNKKDSVNAIKNVHSWIKPYIKLCNSKILKFKNNINVLKDNEFLKEKLYSIEKRIEILETIRLLAEENSAKCNFCGNILMNNTNYIQHNQAYICIDCINICNDIIKEQNCSFDYISQKTANAKNDNHVCCFCGRSSKEVEKLIASEDTYICNGCIGVCNSVIQNGSSFEEEYNKAINNLVVNNKNTSNNPNNKKNITKLLKWILFILFIFLVVFLKYQRITGHF